VTRPREDYGIYDPNAEITADHSLKKFIVGSDCKKSFWFFIFSLLTDPTKMAVISWTGRGLEFKINSQDELVALWKESQQMMSSYHWDSLCRNFRACYKKRIMIPVNTRLNIYAFVTE
ncbi:hypothetical protein PENTCL1PPCAC_25966, partial [Pristionchus entomophagus]